MSSSLAYPGRPGADLVDALAAFGTDWLWFVGPVALAALVGLVLLRRAPAGTPLLHRLSHGAGDVLGLPAWCAGGLVIGTAALLIAVQGFFWDVGWHIAIGRDELLLSPPHLCLLVGLSLMVLAGAASATTATRDGAAAGWRVDRWRVPYGAAALLAAGGAAIVGFGVDELWHAAYGLDVTMWSPPHLVMVSAGGFTPVSLWLLLAEAGPRAGRPLLRPLLLGTIAGAVLVGLSVWQLELDFGLSQWPASYHPILVATAGGFALTAARSALGRGGALHAVGVFVVVRTVLALLTAGAWNLTVPRFVPYLAAAVAVELAFGLRQRRDPGGLTRPVLAGVGVATIGLAGAWAATHLWGWHPWQPSLLATLPVAGAAAVAAAVLGTGFGRAVSFRPTAVRAGAVTASLAVLLLALAWPLPRTAPQAELTIRTAPAGEGAVTVEVVVDPPESAVDVDRFEVVAWQGGGFRAVPLEPVEGGRYAAAQPVPVGGSWKTLVRLGDGSALGAAPVAMPADPEIGAAEIPLVAERTTPLRPDVELMLRERTAGPAWPGAIGYAFTATSLASVIGLQMAGAVGLERRRRGGRADDPGSGRALRLPAGDRATLEPTT